MTIQPSDSILIIDFGSQVTQLIARRVREAGVYSEIAPFNNAEEAFERIKPKGIILSGGPASVTEADSPRAPQCVFDSGLPILGICYGQQVMMEMLGGKVERGGILDSERCTMPYSDAGKVCIDSSNCSGKCVVDSSNQNNGAFSGTCQIDDNPFGCYAEVVAGEAQPALCVD